MFNYSEPSRQAAEILDQYDLRGTLDECKKTNIYDLREQLRLINNEIDNAIEELTIDELIKYLCVRYNMTVDEEIVYYMWYND